MSRYISEALRARVAAEDRGRCRYCQTSQENSGIPLTHEHIIPRSKGGPTVFDNVCLACHPCNEFKTTLTHAVDPATGEIVPLFNPRSQPWSEHFGWSADGTVVRGTSPIGRATVVALRMNRPVVVAVRGRWAIAGWHPPDG